MTLGDAIEFLKTIVSSNVDLKSSISKLEKMAAFLGDSRRLHGGDKEEGAIIQLIRAGEKYSLCSQLQSQNNDQNNDFNLWAEKLSTNVSNVMSRWKNVGQVYNRGTAFLQKNGTTRKNIIIGMLIAVIVIAVAFAIIAIYGLVDAGENSWAGKLATILGTVDFVVGVLGFSVERICDMKGKSVERQLERVKTISSDDSGAIQTWLNDISISIGNQKATGCCNFQFRSNR